MSTMSKSTMVAVAGAAVATIGTFLPFIAVSFAGFSQSTNYLSGGDDGGVGDGVFVIALTALAAGLHFWRKAKWSLVPSLIALAVVIYDFTQFQKAKNAVNSLFQAFGGDAAASATNISLGVGFYVVLLGVLAAIAAGFMKSGESSGSQASSSNSPAAPTAPTPPATPTTPAA